MTKHSQFSERNGFAPSDRRLKNCSVGGLRNLLVTVRLDTEGVSPRGTPGSSGVVGWSNAGLTLMVDVCGNYFRLSCVGCEIKCRCNTISK